MARRHLFTSESVSEGHPDKVCDAVSDAVLDEALRLDPYARVACETAATTDYLVLMGEITCAGRIDFERIARDTVRRIGYDDPELRFDADGICALIRMKRFTRKTRPATIAIVIRSSTIAGIFFLRMNISFKTEESHGIPHIGRNIRHYAPV